jgi:hypothetical protein
MSCHTGSGGGGGGRVREMSPGGGEFKKCGKSVTYYLNGPPGLIGSKNIIEVQLYSLQTNLLIFFL